MICRVAIVLMTASLALSTPAPAAAQARRDLVEPGARQWKTWGLDSGNQRQSRLPTPSDAAAAELAVVRSPATQRGSEPGLDPSWFEAMCQAEGWGYWWDGNTCRTNVDSLTRPREQTPGLHGGW